MYYLSGLDDINSVNQNLRYWSALMSDGFGWDAAKAKDRTVKFLFSTTGERASWKLLHSTKFDDNMLYTAFLSQDGYILLVWVPDDFSDSMWDSISKLDYLDSV